MLRYAIASSLVCSSFVFATPTVIQPDETASKDTFVYQNFATTTATGLYTMLGNPDAAGTASRTLMVGGSSTTHRLRTLLQFDLSTISLSPGEQALVDLKVINSNLTSINIGDPSAAFSAQVSIWPLASTPAWDEDATWNTQADISGATALDTEIITGTGNHVQFDVTAQIQTWINNGFTGYNGFGLTMDFPVFDAVNLKTVGVFFAGAGVTTSADRPSLTIIPEPASLGMLAGVTGLLMRRRKTK